MKTVEDAKLAFISKVAIGEAEVDVQPLSPALRWQMA